MPAPDDDPDAHAAQADDPDPAAVAQLKPERALNAEFVALFNMLPTVAPNDRRVYSAGHLRPCRCRPGGTGAVRHLRPVPILPQRSGRDLWAQHVHPAHGRTGGRQPVTLRGVELVHDGPGRPRSHLLCPIGERSQHPRQRRPAGDDPESLFPLPRCHGPAPVPPGRRRRLLHARYRARDRSGRPQPQVRRAGA